MNRLLSFILLLGCICILLRSQTSDVYGNNHLIDSLKAELQKEQPDTIRIKMLNSLGWQLMYEQSDTSIILGNQALELSTKIGHEKSIASSNGCIGVFYYIKSNYSKALQHYFKALEGWKKLGNKKGISSTLSNIGLAYEEQRNYPGALEIYLEALEIDKKLGDQLGTAIRLGNIGLVYEEQRDYTNALKYYFEALTLGREMNDKSLISSNLGNIGNAYNNMENFPKALIYYQEALEIDRALEDNKAIARNLGNIGTLYSQQAKKISDKNQKAKKYKEAERYLKNAVQICDSIGYIYAKKEFEKSLSDVYSNTQQYFLALEHYKLYTLHKDSIFNETSSKQITEMETKYQTEKKEQQIALQNSELEKNSIAMDKQKAEIQQRNAIVFAVVAGLGLSLLFGLLILRSYRAKKKAYHLLAEQNNKILLQNSEILQQKEEIQTQADNLAMVNEELVQQKEEILTQAEMLHEVNIELEKLSIVASETDNAITISDQDGNIEWVNEGFVKLYGFTQEEFTDKIGSNIIIASTNPQIKEAIQQCIDTGENSTYISENKTKSGENIWVQTTLTAINGPDGYLSKLIAIDSDVTQLKKAEAQINEQHDQLQIVNNEIVKKNKNITDSIQYAQKIQTAILPSTQDIKSYLPDFFVFFQPKDIVSGDFYWFHAEDDKLFIAAADCTGHGVPGAFMSMIGISMLNEIVKEKKVHQPSEILAKLDQGVLQALSQNTSLEKSQIDGMDISLCCIDLKKSKLSISLAGHTAFLFSDNTQKKIKGDYFSICGFRKGDDITFTNHEFDIEREMTLYMYSDGYQDQFGGSDNLKFMVSRFQELLASLPLLSADKQHTILSQTFSDWKGTRVQIDDILVMGIKIPYS